VVQRKEGRGRETAGLSQSARVLARGNGRAESGRSAAAAEE
jgi:hypothetical protein